MPNVGILVGDIVGSREASDRQKLQSDIQSSLDEVNDEVDGSSIAPMEIVRGDEFEGGFRDPSACIEAFFTLERILFPVRFKAGIGVGEISTSEDTSISRMDGPAFHRARAAVEEAKSSASDLLIRSNNQSRDAILNTILDLLTLLKERWTDRQWEIVNHYRENRDRTQSEIAYEFGISQPAVAKVLQRTKIKHIDGAKEVLAHELKSMVN